MGIRDVGGSGLTREISREIPNRWLTSDRFADVVTALPIIVYPLFLGFFIWLNILICNPGTLPPQPPSMPLLIELSDVEAFLRSFEVSSTSSIADTAAITTREVYLDITPYAVTSSVSEIADPSPSSGYHIDNQSTRRKQMLYVISGTLAFSLALFFLPYVTFGL